MKPVLLALLVGLPATSISAAEPEKPPEFEEHYFVLLMRPKNPPKFSEAELEELQRKHLGHFEKMFEAGKLVVAGPFSEQPDERYRGLCLYKVKTKEEAKQLAEQDPMVKAGRLEVVVMKWHTEKGAIAFPMAEAAMAEKRR